MPRYELLFFCAYRSVFVDDVVAHEAVRRTRKGPSHSKKRSPLGAQREEWES
jgi:hypothetical protein